MSCADVVVQLGCGEGGRGGEGGEGGEGGGGVEGRTIGHTIPQH